MSVPTMNGEPGISHAVSGVRWEPCTAFHDDPADAAGVCAGCGWAPDDHRGESHLAEAA